MLPDRDQEIAYSHARTYLPSSAIKVDDSPIRNLTYNQRHTRQGNRNIRAAADTTVTTAIMSRYHYYSARYFDSQPASLLRLVRVPASTLHLEHILHSMRIKERRIARNPIVRI